METLSMTKDPTNDMTIPNPQPHRRHLYHKSQTLPPSPTHLFHSSSSSSDFEFTISLPLQILQLCLPRRRAILQRPHPPSPPITSPLHGPHPHPPLLPSSASYSFSSDTTTSPDSTGSSFNESCDSTSSFANDLMLLDPRWVESLRTWAKWADDGLGK
ncbi:hypothetical protein ACFX15_001177 [Malus domestica]